MKPRHFFSAVFFLLLLFAVSCSNSGKQVFEKIITSDKNDFRGVSIRSGLEEVKAAENQQPQSEESDYLFYEIQLGQKEEYYKLEYSFNEKGLYEILADVYLKKPEDALQLFQQLSEYFKSRYGTPGQEDETTIVWTIKTEKSPEVELTLADESANDSGKISVSFYDLAY